MQYVFVGLFLGTIIFSTTFQIMQIDLLRLYWCDVRRRRCAPSSPPPLAILPTVTIQLPMYNESAVAERILDAVVQIDYPRDRLQIQVLDDSTDHCSQLLERKLEELRAADPTIRIEYRHRCDRTGFKAGNLNDALSSVSGDLLAIFDADFVPRPDFLTRLIPFFGDPKTGVVQSRWGHLNAKDSFVTRVQEMFLDGHHTVEQRGRSAGNLLLTFNGSAGIWRTQIISELGGWNASTTTEDIYLSVAAQLRGYRIEFVEDYVTYGELPDSIVGLRQQMFRWFKGGAQTCRHFFREVLMNSGSLRRRLHGALFLLSPFAMVSSLINVLLCGMLPLVLYWSPDTAGLMPLTLIGAGWAPIMFAVYGTARIRFDEGPLWWNLVRTVPRTLTLLAMTAGLSCQSSVAVIEALLGRKNQWAVTPKGFSTGGAGIALPSRGRIPWYFWLDGLVLIYLFISLGIAIAFSAWFFMLVLTVWLGGYIWLFGGALVEVYRPSAIKTSERKGPATATATRLNYAETLSQ